MNALEPNQINSLTIDALERMAFIIADPVDSVEAELDLLGGHTSIHLEGQEEACDVHISASDGFLCELASNMLGIDPDSVDPEEEGIQALLELTNILGGEVIKALGGEQRPFDLGLPTTADPGVASASDGKLLCNYFDVEGDSLRVQVHHRAL